MTLSRSVMLKTQLSIDELLALHPCDIVEKGRGT